MSAVPRSTIEDMRRLLRDLSYKARIGVVTGPAVYIDVENLDSGFVLVDMIVNVGCDRLAQDLFRLLRGVERELAPPGSSTKRQRAVVTPSRERWKALRTRTLSLLAELEAGLDVAAERAKPFVALEVERIRLNAGGYDRSGRYWGTGGPSERLFRVSNTGGSTDRPPVPVRGLPRLERGRWWKWGQLFYWDEPDKTAWIDTHVRAPDAAKARALVARELGTRIRREVC